MLHFTISQIFQIEFAFINLHFRHNIARYFVYRFPPPMEIVDKVKTDGSA